MDFISVRISTLNLNIQLGFNLYIQLPSRFVHYIRSDDTFDEIVKKNLQEKKIRKLFIKTEEEQKYLDFLDRCLAATMNQTDLDFDQKGQVVASAAKDLTEQVYTKEMSEKSYKHTEKASKTLKDLIEKDAEIFKSICQIKSSDQDSLLDKILQHSISSSTLCIAYGSYLKLPNEQIEQLAQAALLHDMAFTKMEENDRICFFTQLKNIPAAKLTNYKKHPQIAVDLLNDKPYANKTIIELIKTHEEKISGDGFPQKLTKLSDLQEIHSLCCHFDRRVNCLGEKIQDVINDLMIGELGQYSMERLKNFKAFLSGHFVKK